MWLGILFLVWQSAAMDIFKGMFRGTIASSIDRKQIMCMFTVSRSPLSDSGNLAG